MTSVGVASLQLLRHCSSFIRHARWVVPHCSFLKANQQTYSGGCILLRFLWWASSYSYLYYSVVWFMAGSHVLRRCPYGLEYLKYYQPPAIRDSRSCLYWRVLLGLDIWNDLSAYGENWSVLEEQGTYGSTRTKLMTLRLELNLLLCFVEYTHFPFALLQPQRSLGYWHTEDISMATASLSLLELH